jgi:DNA topoisomerase VI subunit A
MIKRDHKLIDYDRHRTSLEKLNKKTERSFSEEKQIFKVIQELCCVSSILLYNVVPIDSITIRDCYTGL